MGSHTTHTDSVLSSVKPKLEKHYLAQRPDAGQGRLLLRILDHIELHITLSRTPLDEVLARRRDFYLIKHKTHRKQISLPAARFEPAIPASEWEQTLASDGWATWIGTANTNFFTYLYRNLRWIANNISENLADYYTLKMETGSSNNAGKATCPPNHTAPHSSNFPLTKSCRNLAMISEIKHFG